LVPFDQDCSVPRQLAKLLRLLNNSKCPRLYLLRQILRIIVDIKLAKPSDFVIHHTKLSNDPQDVGSLRRRKPKEFPGQWSGHPLSYADPNAFRAYFQPLLDKLNAAGVRLAAFELGNELNSSAFNSEFPLPGQGRMFGLEDLSRDPEAKQIAAGYLQYLKVLAALRDIRNHSKVNNRTPVLTAGFAVYEGPEGPVRGARTDSVSVNATLDFLRAHGVDKLVDAYAVHVYPWSSNPGDPSAAAARRDRLAKYVLGKCHRAGTPDGKPCWITEWGFKNTSTNCPVDDRVGVQLVEEMRNNFAPYVRERKLLGLIYYAWIDEAEHYGIYRCDGLMESGRLAIAPM